jgi:hypothetical protein
MVAAEVAEQAAIQAIQEVPEEAAVVEQTFRSRPVAKSM